MRGVFTSVLALLGLTACAVGPDYRLPAEAQINAASAQGSFVSSEPAIAAAAPVPDGWWQLYDDVLLDHLENEALAANTDLRVAAANLARAQALQSAAEGEHDIKAGAEFTAERAQLSGQSFLLPVQMPSQYLGNGGIKVSYQLDLFGRLQRAAEAAGADREASAAGLELVEITAAAEVARSYAEACSANNERQVAEHNLALQQRTQSVTEQLVDAGRESTTAVTRAAAQVEQARAAIPQFQARQRLALYRLAVLTGHPPSEYPRAVETCVVPPKLGRPLPVGDGAALLKRRPDIRQAERGLAAATARIGVATAALYPDISFGLSAGSIGLLDALTLPSAQFWGLGPTISWTVPDRASHARIEAAGATANAALAHFDGVVLNALRETESSLTTYARDLERNASLRAARDRFAEAAVQTETLYLAGRSPYLNNLSASHDLAQAELALAMSDDQLTADQVALFLALGGGWSADQKGSSVK
jgi:NodT family efflux transporter outer membrane factor (OMF) lipoprotein